MLASKLLQDQRGGVTAEFALTLPAVLLLLGLVVSSVQLSAQRVALISLAGDISRLEARGDRALAAARAEHFTGNVVLTRELRGQILCVTAASAPGTGVLAAFTVTGKGCAVRSEFPETGKL